MEIDGAHGPGEGGYGPLNGPPLAARLDSKDGMAFALKKGLFEFCLEGGGYFFGGGLIGVSFLNDPPLVRGYGSRPPQSVLSQPARALDPPPFY